MFSNEFVGIIVLIATFTVGLLVGWKFWGQAAKKAVDDKRDVEQDVLNERRKGTALQQKWDAAQVEIDTHKKRVADLEAHVSVAPVPVDDGASKAALEAVEKARNEADARAQLAEARALEAEKRLSENEQRARGADTLLKKVEVRAEGRSEIEEAKAKREAEAAAAKAKAEADAKADADAKAKADADVAKAKADADAKAKADADAAKAKADADAKAKADAEAQAKADAETAAAIVKAEADAKAAAAQAKADAETAAAIAKAEADAKASVSAKPEGVSDAFWAMFGDKVPVAEPGAKDQLVGTIKGIGPITGKRLNDLGIYTYAQVAAFDSEIVARVAAAVGAIPAKAEKDDWPGQAKKKLAEGTTP